MEKIYVDAKKNNGEPTKALIFVMSEDEYQDLGADQAGLCLACGAEVYYVEPDAVGYRCEECDARRVVGVEQALLIGRIRFKEDA